MAFSNIGRQLKDRRKEESLTQEQAAEAIGVDQTTISDWESAQTVPRSNQIPALAKFLKVDADFLLRLRQVDLEQLGTGVKFPERLIFDEAVQKVAKADPKNIQEVAASQLDIVNSYYQSGLQQSQQSFRWSLVWGGIGSAFLVVAVSVLLFRQPSEVAWVSVLAGAIIEVFAGTYLALYKNASDQLAAFRVSLEETQLLLLANGMCERLEGELEQATRAEIVRQIVGSVVDNRRVSQVTKKK